jgi:hypothetical protein
MEQSDQMTGLIIAPSPNEMLQQEFVGLPNVDVTLPGFSIQANPEMLWRE